MQQVWTALHPVSQQASSKEVGYKKNKKQKKTKQKTMKL